MGRASEFHDNQVFAFRLLVVRPSCWVSTAEFLPWARPTATLSLSALLEARGLGFAQRLTASRGNVNVSRGQDNGPLFSEIVCNECYTHAHASLSARVVIQLSALRSTFSVLSASVGAVVAPSPRAAGGTAQPHHHRAGDGVKTGQGTGVHRLPKAGIIV